jgi:hypothetical protein
MVRPLGLVSAAALAVAAALALVVGPGLGLAAAPEPGQSTCAQYGSFPVAGGKYVVQNDRWGAATEQCLTAFDTGFRLDKAEHTNNAGPAGYPSIYRGCNYGYCTVGSPFPAPVASLGALRSNWTTTGPTGGGTQQYNTAYDIWFNPTNASPGRNTGAELMVWLNRTSWVQPIGRHYFDVYIAGTRWQVWYGRTDLPVISYVRVTPTTSVTNLPLDAFVRDARLRGVVKPAWYLTSVQAGFEPWTGGTGLSTTAFSVTRNGN